MDGDWSSTNWAVGNVLLSRFPFSTTTRHALTADQSVAQGTIVVHGRTVNLFSTHVDYDSASNRATQISQIKSWASSWAENRIIMGDFNSNPGSSDYNTMNSPYRGFVDGRGFHGRLRRPPARRAIRTAPRASTTCGNRAARPR